MTRRGYLHLSVGLLPLALSLAACMGGLRPAAPTSAPAAVVEGTVVLSAARGFAVAELSYITAADGARRLTRAGIIRGATAKQVRLWNAEARKLLVKGKAAIDAGQQARAASSLLDLAARIDGVAKGL